MSVVLSAGVSVLDGGSSRVVEGVVPGVVEGGGGCGSRGRDVTPIRMPFVITSPANTFWKLIESTNLASRHLPRTQRSVCATLRLCVPDRGNAVCVPDQCKAETKDNKWQMVEICERYIHVLLGKDSEQ